MKFRFWALKLAGICIIVFVLQSLISGFTDLFVLSNSHVFEIWRFISAIFLHGSVGHLFYNLFALALFGSILEGIIGSRKLLHVFFTSGIFANIFAAWFYPSSLGASGAIFGILGALVILRPMMVVWLYGMPMPMFIAGVLWAAGDIIGLFVPSNVGHIAHLSGMAVGLLFGIILRKLNSMEMKREQKIKLVIDEKSMRHWEDYHLK